MSLIPRFVAYAAAFEKAYESRDFSVLEPFFTEDAVYEVPLPGVLGGRWEGRAVVLACLESVTDRFDRRFASRVVALVAGPREEKDSVWLRGSAHYTAPGLPDLHFELEETARFRGDRICHLSDHNDEADTRALTDNLGAHGAKLGIEGA